MRLFNPTQCDVVVIPNLIGHYGARHCEQLFPKSLLTWKYYLANLTATYWNMRRIVGSLKPILIIASDLYSKTRESQIFNSMRGIRVGTYFYEAAFSKSDPSRQCIFMNGFMTDVDVFSPWNGNTWIGKSVYIESGIKKGAWNRAVLMRKQ